MREPSGITRNGCHAQLRVKFDKLKGKYMVTKLVVDHTHKLVQSHETQFLRSHQVVTDADLAHAKALRQVGVKMCQFMDYKSDQAGGFHHVGYLGKDMQNRIDASQRAQIIDTNTEAAIAYLSGRVEYDVGVFFEYTMDEENRLRNLFWTDTVVRYDYEQFGDVLAFDATYKKNAYNKPLVAFVGVNHYKRTTIFGFALLIDETVQSYVWLLQTFLSAMQQKKPTSVITDGDKAMSKAIKTVMFGCVHRLCAWHLERNAQANVKNEEFASKFQQLMLNPMTPEEFERLWFSVMYEMGLDQNPWIQKMYAKWAEAYLKGTFFAGMRTTQRCESLNLYLCRFVQQKLKLYDFIRQIHRAMYCIRHKEVQDEFDTNHIASVLTTHLHSIEKHTSEIYTRNVFHWVRTEILGEATLIMLDCAKISDSHVYTLTKFQHPKQRWIVVFYNKVVDFSCSCKMMESAGIPCRHIFHVMKLEQIVRMPETLIMGRWTKSAKVDKAMKMTAAASHIDQEASETAKFASLSASCNNLCRIAAMNDESYMLAFEEIQRLTLRYEKMQAEMKQ